METAGFFLIKKAQLVIDYTRMENTEKKQDFKQLEKDKNRHSSYNKKSSPERIRFIKAKYRNGIPKGEIERWINGL